MPIKCSFLSPICMNFWRSPCEMELGHMYFNKHTRCMWYRSCVDHTLRSINIIFIFITFMNIHVLFPYSIIYFGKLQKRRAVWIRNTTKEFYEKLNQNSTSLKVTWNQIFWAISFIRKIWSFSVHRNQNKRENKNHSVAATRFGPIKSKDWYHLGAVSH